MKLVPALLFFIAIFVGCLVVMYAGAVVATETYNFWKHGVEAEATVVSLEDVYHGRGGKTYYYKLSIQDQEHIDGFPYELSIGDTITVLFLPETPNQLALADEKSSLFEIFSSKMGGWIWAVLVVVLDLFMLGMAILMLVCIWHVFWRIMLNE